MTRSLGIGEDEEIFSANGSAQTVASGRTCTGQTTASSLPWARAPRKGAASPAPQESNVGKEAGRPQSERCRGPAFHRARARDSLPECKRGFAGRTAFGGHE